MANIWVLCASGVQRKQLESLFAGFSAPHTWLPQRNTLSTFQTRFDAEANLEELASEMARIGAPFELEDFGQRFLFHPGLGIHRQQLDESGEVVLRIGQLRQLLSEAEGSNAELMRLIRMAEGQAWLDLLEPYRLSIQRIELLPRAV